MFEEVVSYDSAVSEVNALLDKKKVLPSRRKALEMPIATVAEAIQYGYVSINEKGEIKQTLVEPLLDKVSGAPVVLELNYAARIAPATINAKLATLKDANNITQKLMVYTTSYTNEVAGVINQLEPTDRNTCDAISLFFI